MSVEIFYHQGAAWEEWLYLEPDGTLQYHGENDGLRFLRKGPEAIDKRLTVEEAVRRFPDYADKIRALLKG